jgi:hypothetical protein
VIYGGNKLQYITMTNLGSGKIRITGKTGNEKFRNSGSWDRGCSPLRPRHQLFSVPLSRAGDFNSGGCDHWWFFFTSELMI